MRKRNISGIEFARFKVLRDDGLLHRGSGLSENILVGLLLPVVFHAGIRDARPKRRPHGGGISARIHKKNQKFSVYRLPSNGVKGHICHS